MPMIELRDVTKVYVKGDSEIVTLDHMSLSIQQGDFVALMGPSGSGKTTLLNLIGGLDTPTEGQVVVCDQHLSDLTSRELARWRADHVAFVFQAFNLLPVLTALQNVELPLGLQPLSGGQRREHATAALSAVGLGDRLHHRPSELSGGQEQRVAIARALACDTPMILADEPTGDLDAHSAEEVMQLFRRLNEELGKTIIMVTHDPRAAHYARREFHLDKGVLSLERAK